MKKKIVITSALALVAIPMSAQFFGGLPVYDAASHLEGVLRTSKLVAQLQQLAATYREVKGHYDEYQKQVTYLKTMAARYRSPMVAWRGITASNNSGKTSPWVIAANSGGAAPQGWQTATNDLMVYGGAFNMLPREQQERKALDFAGLELADGVGIGALDTVGRIRAAGPDFEQTLKRLEEDSLADNDKLQTEAAQLNKANALAILQIKQLADANKLGVSISEMNMLQMRMYREAAAKALAADVAFRAAGTTVPTPHKS
jgi:hypothetical protein